MSRVSENQSKRADAERLQKKVDQKSRDTKARNKESAQFGQLIKRAGQDQRGQAMRGKQTAQQKQGEHLQQKKGKSADESARNARLARGGTLQHSRVMEQAKSFHSTLNDKRVETEGEKKANVTERDEGLKEDKKLTVDRQSDLDTKAEDKKEMSRQQAKADAKAKGEPNAAISGDSNKGGEKGDGNEESNIEAAKKAGQQNEVKEADGAQGAAGAKQLPPEVVEALVKQIHMGVDAKGLAMFRIEMKDGALAGAAIEVKADGGKIHLGFTGVDQQTQNLIHASRGSLMRALESKGLALDQLTFG